MGSFDDSMVSFLLRKDSFYIITITNTLVFNYILRTQRNIRSPCFTHLNISLGPAIFIFSTGVGFVPGLFVAVFVWIPMFDYGIDILFFFEYSILFYSILFYSIQFNHLQSVTFLSMLAPFQVHPLLPSNGDGSALTAAVIKLHLRRQAQSHHSIIPNVLLIHPTGRALLLLLLLSVPDTFHSSNDATTALISRLFGLIIIVHPHVHYIFWNSMMICIHPMFLFLPVIWMLVVLIQILLLMRSVSIDFVSISFNNNYDVDTFHVHQLYFFCNNDTLAWCFVLLIVCRLQYSIGNALFDIF